MSRFSNRKEYDLERLLQEHGWEARRQPGSGSRKRADLKGDVLASREGFPDLLIDHKSSQSTDCLTLSRPKWENILGLVSRYREQTGRLCVGLVTYSLYRYRTQWAMTDRVPEVPLLMEEVPYGIILLRVQRESS